MWSFNSIIFFLLSIIKTIHRVVLLFIKHYGIFGIFVFLKLIVIKLFHFMALYLFNKVFPNQNVIDTLWRIDQFLNLNSIINLGKNCHI